MAEAEQNDNGSDYIFVYEGSWKLGSEKGAYSCDKNGLVKATFDDHPELTSTSQFVFNPAHSEPLPADPPQAPITVDCFRGDVMKLIEDSRSQGCFFLLPSQLNGAEYCTNAKPTTAVKDYVWDNTGGPAGQLSGHPGIAQFILDNAENSYHFNKGINSVKEFLFFVNPDDGSTPLENVNGYLKVAANVADPKAFISRMRENMHRIRVPAMLNVQASGLRPGRKIFSLNQHSINLIYGSGVPVGTYGNSYTQFVKDVAFEIVVSQYYGGIKLAATQKASRIFLMLLGAGVFNMDVPTVLRAIDQAINLLYADENVREILSKLRITILTYASHETDVVKSRLKLRNQTIPKDVEMKD